MGSEHDTGQGDHQLFNSGNCRLEEVHERNPTNVSMRLLYKFNIVMNYILQSVYGLLMSSSSRECYSQQAKNTPASVGRLKLNMLLLFSLSLSLSFPFPLPLLLVRTLFSIRSSRSPGSTRSSRYGRSLLSARAGWIGLLCRSGRSGPTLSSTSLCVPITGSTAFDGGGHILSWNMIYYALRSCFVSNRVARHSNG